MPFEHPPLGSIGTKLDQAIGGVPSPFHISDKKTEYRHVLAGWYVLWILGYGLPRTSQSLFQVQGGQRAQVPRLCCVDLFGRSALSSFFGLSETLCSFTDLCKE